MNDGEKFADAISQAYEANRAYNQGPLGPSSPQPVRTVGGGAGEVNGWAVILGVIGVVIGGLFGQGLFGAILGALVLGGGGWALAALAGGSGGSGVSRGSVIRWALLGAIGFAAFGAFVVAETAARAANAAFNWAFLGALLCGGYRLIKRARS